MRTDSRIPAVLLAALALALAAALSVPAQAPPALKPAPRAVLQDRVLAVVDEDPILASDVDRVVKLGLVKPAAGEAPEAYRRRVLDSLIEERLRFHEIDRFGFEQVPMDEIERQVAAIRSGFTDDASFQKALKDVGLDLKGLRQLATRQLLVLTYVDDRLGPRVFVTVDDINRYYRTVLTTAMQKSGKPVPPVDDVRDDIREVLKQQKLTQELAAWTGELRARAEIVIHGGSPAGKPLPPVVKRIP